MKTWICNVDCAEEIIIKSKKKPTKKEVFDKFKKKMKRRNATIYIDYW